ncbi:MAG: formate dehydrogenase accessory protein FdhE [Burkholderiales bacterium]|jgi:FdhE protein|nr:formate dehydrogenase accessory protein FdhE [Burkholderiales bacterium]
MTFSTPELGGSFVSPPPLLQPDLRTLYVRRHERLLELAQTSAPTSHPLADYLSFVAGVVNAQREIAQNHPLSAPLDAQPLVVDWHVLPLDWRTYPRDAYWRTALDHLIDRVAQAPSISTQPVIAATLKRLRAMNDAARESAATRLLASDVSLTGVDGAPFFWAALSLYWAQLSRRHSLDVHEDVGVARHRCPVCGNDPVASIVQIGPPEGVRYLHCALCETEWHVVRAQCTNCEASGKLHYWSLDDKDAAVKTESCGDCRSHLKILYQNKNGHVDPVADDLASLALDARMEEEGFARSAINPFLFRQEP